MFRLTGGIAPRLSRPSRMPSSHASASLRAILPTGCSFDRRTISNGTAHRNQEPALKSRSELTQSLETQRLAKSSLSGQGTAHPPSQFSWGRDYLFLQDPETGHRQNLTPVMLRDHCQCSACRDPSSGQKSFASTEIPLGIGLKSVRPADDGLAVTFAGDIPRLDGLGSAGSARPGEHEMLLPGSTITRLLGRHQHLRASQSVLEKTGVVHWDKAGLASRVRRIDYAAFMSSSDDDGAMWDAVVDLSRLGIVYLDNVPRDPESVAHITTRIASVRETFYGRTFDVRAKPNAENVAYTSGYLGLHQDLLYLDPQPRIQVLHCVENSCEGGESLFSDGDRVGRLLYLFRDQPVVRELLERPVPYAYTKNGFSYHHDRKLLTAAGGGTSPSDYEQVFWSPPFQGSFLTDSAPEHHLRSPSTFPNWVAQARAFESLINADHAVYRHRMKPGECVLFDNVRVMHGRTAFEDRRGGSRWLRGAYIAPDDFRSRALHVPAGKLAALRQGGEGEYSGRDVLEHLRQSRWMEDVMKTLREVDPNVILPSVQ